MIMCQRTRKHGEISASMMCADFLHMEKELDSLEKAGIEYLHYDIMDGYFVPNYTLGPCVLENLRRHTKIPADIHLMINRPEDKLKYFQFVKGDLVSVHYEATNHIQRLLATLREMGVHPGVAINPGTPVNMLYDLLDDIDFVLIMTVNPGFAGQSLVPRCLNKIREVRKIIEVCTDREVLIEVDGNVNLENARKMRAAGADIFVAGSSGLFIRGKNIQDTSVLLREAIL